MSMRSKQNSSPHMDIEIVRLGIGPCRIYMLQGGKDCTGMVVIMNLLLMTVALTLLPVTSADDMDSMIHAAANRAGIFPATTEKVRAL